MHVRELTFLPEPPIGFEDLFSDWLDEVAVDRLAAMAPDGELPRLWFRRALMPLALVGRGPERANLGGDDDADDLALIEALADAYRADPDSVPPPIISFSDGRVGVLDGTHRLDGAALAGQDTVCVWVCQAS